MFTPDTIKLSANIHATPERVFAILLDYRSYDVWNPWIRHIATRQGKKNDFIADHGMYGQVKHRLTAVTPPERLCWNLSGWQRFLVQAQREMMVYPVAGGDALVTLKITLSGPLLPIVRLLFKHRIKRRVAAELKALKERAEQPPAPAVSA